MLTCPRCRQQTLAIVQDHDGGGNMFVACHCTDDTCGYHDSTEPLV